MPTPPPTPDTGKPDMPPLFRRKHVTLYIARKQPPNTIAVRYWRLLRLGKGREIALTQIDNQQDA